MALSLEQAVHRLRSAHPKARFFHLEAPEEGSEAPHILKFYEHKITNRFDNIGGNSFIIDNSFLPSHVYNQAVLWILATEEPSRFSEDWLISGVRFSFKKFFSECLVDIENCLIGRALLIETLVYEQDLVRPVFERLSQDPILAGRAEVVAQQMGLMLLLHEQGHSLIASNEVDLDSVYAELVRLVSDDSRREVFSTLPSDLKEDVVCDYFAMRNVLDNEFFPGSGSSANRSRIASFFWKLFPFLRSLEKSAQATARQVGVRPDVIELGSEIRSTQVPEYSLETSQSMFARSRAAHALLEREESLDCADVWFPAVDGAGDLFGKAFQLFAEHESGPIVGDSGTTLERRNIVRLLAEAMHDNEAAAKHLLWRGKVFRRDGDPIDP